MKISDKKIEKLIESKVWIVCAENSYGMLYWNKITGESIWRDWEGKDSDYFEPEYLKKRKKEIEDHRRYFRTQ